jgi:NAD(P)-dependent dehydrogenase (short-subunit alcohol dehydrogenase family)
MKADGKTIVVTGGGSGMGRELTLNLLGKGARVAAADINASTLRETAEIAGAGDRLSTHVLNVTDRAAVEAFPAAVITAHGQVDGIINNAGIIQPFVRFNDLEYEAIDRVMDVNFWGVVYMTKAFLPHLLKRPVAHVVSISSMGGFLPVPGQTMYGASKAAVKLMTEGLNSELTDTNVSVTVVFPGAIATNITENSGVEAPIGDDAGDDEPQKEYPTTSASDAAEIIVEGMERDAYRVRVGKDAKMMDRLSRLAPERAASIIYKQMRDLLPG